MAAHRRRRDGSGSGPGPGPGSPLPWAPAGPPAAVEWLEEGWHLRLVQPYQARKVYRCPGCDHEIFPGTLHVVAWPDGDPEERRHWHRPCWRRHAAELARRRERRR